MKSKTLTLAATAIAAGDFAQARVWLEEGARLYPQLANPNPSTQVFLQSNLATLDLHAGRIGYHRRPGLHYFSREDWNRFIAFFESKQ